MSQLRIEAPSPTLHEELNAANSRGRNMKGSLVSLPLWLEPSLHLMGDFKKRHPVR